MVGPSTTTVKFLCSYGGKIFPGFHDDGKLRYQGGHTRVLSVQRSVSFAELMMKLGELCGASVSFRCQLPSEDLDALVSITCHEDLGNLIEEYDKAAAATSSSLKIRAFLSPQKSVKKVSPRSPSASSPFISVNSKSSRCPVPYGYHQSHGNTAAAAGHVCGPQQQPLEIAPAFSPATFSD